MTFATAWGDRVILRCPRCHRIACTEHPRGQPQLRLVTSMQQSKEAQTIIQCRGCRVELEVARAIPA